MYQALFAKAVEISWKQTERFSHILLRMGTFHTICNALSILGKRFGDSGVKDICIEAELVAEGSINGVLDGKHYNRAIRIHKYIYEALMRLAWTGFSHWVEDNVSDRSAVINSFLEQVNRIVCELNQHQLSNLLQSPLLEELMGLWGDFLEHLRHSNGELSAYWMSYIDVQYRLKVSTHLPRRSRVYYSQLSLGIPTACRFFTEKNLRSGAKVAAGKFT